MKMEKIQAAQTILAENSVVELADADLAKVHGGRADRCHYQRYCQSDWDNGSDWGDDNSYYKNSFNNDNNDNNNTNFNLLNGFSIL
jgi:hypothetical protein